MLAMVVNDNAGRLTPSGVFESIASMLAPTGGAAVDSGHCNALLNGRRTMFCAFSEPKYNQSPYSRTVVIGE